MKGSAKLKVAGGKLVAVRLDFDDSIRSIEILGDFFMHPEEKISEIEKGLIGTDARAEEVTISRRVEELARSNGIEMIGVTPEAIACTIKRAIRNGMEDSRA